MLNNYLKTALRNLYKYRGFSFINLLGLAVGMACCVLILLYVQDELSFDRYHEHADRIYRVTREWFNEDGTSSLHLGHVAPPIAPLLVNDFPDIQEAVRIQTPGRMLCSREDKHFIEEDIIFADENLFSLFSFTLRAGDPATALRDPFSVLLTPETARRYFGDADPLGQTLKFANRVDAKITGVVEPAPANSHFHFDIVGSLSTLRKLYGQREFENWGSNNYATYLLLPEGYDMARLAAQIPAFLDRHRGENAHRANALHFQRLTDIHLRSHLDSEIEANGDITYVYVFSAVALFVLLIACINFMNLSTARSSVRAREVGLRKVVGAQRGHLIRQFLGESVLLAFFSLLLCVAVVKLVLPPFSRFVNRTLTLNPLQDPGLLLGLLGLTILVGLVAGSYPALYLSGFQPSGVLKGIRGSARRGSRFRTVLVVFQFSVTIVLLVSVSVVYRQLHFSRSKSLGFQQEQIVVLPTSAAIRQRFDSLSTQWLSHPGIRSAAASRRVPSDRLLDSSGARVISADGEMPVNFRIAFVRVSHDFIPTYGMEMASGRNFSREFPTDLKEAFILNEEAVRKIGWTAENALGRSFKYGSRTGAIIGVVKDFHFESLHQPIAPLVLYLQPDYRHVSLRLRPENIPQTMAYLKDRWSELRPNYPFDYFFIDENFDSLYRSEERLGQIFGVFSLLAVGIACLGLLGLASFSAERRIKEIGIRKVLGAAMPGLLLLLSRDFTRWVLAANLIAWPLAYLIMGRWLQNFAYRVGLRLTDFILAGVLAFAVALLTVSFQTVKAALGNPIDSLRYE